MASLHLTRLLRLITLIRAGEAHGPKDLARELEVGVRTIHRDLKVLEYAGMPCTFDREAGRYRMDGDFFLPPMQLSLTEAMALSVLGTELAGRDQLPFMKDAWRAVTKIRGQLPAGIRDNLTAIDGTVKVQAARVSPLEGCEEHFETLRQAIAGTRKVKCTYVRAAGANGKEDGRAGAAFHFRPYALYFGQRAWYVIGHSEKSGGERTLKLNRLKSVIATDRPYMIPAGWSVEKSFGRAWRMIRGERRYLVKIRFDAEHASNVADTLWHPTQRIAWEADGSCIFHCEVDGLDEIVWWVLGHGPHAEVISPTELSEAICDLVRSMFERYGMVHPPHEISPADWGKSSRLP